MRPSQASSERTGEHASCSVVRVLEGHGVAYVIRAPRHQRDSNDTNSQGLTYHLTTKHLQLHPQEKMSTTPSLPKFIVWAPDYSDEGAFQRRMAKLVSQGVMRLGGGFMTPESVDAAAADKKFIG
ncbi:hypothetical protein BDR07DRAFT_1466009, partial [Suillus spraguei]